MLRLCEFAFHIVVSTVRQYAFDGAGLHEWGRITFDGNPGNILCDVEQDALIIEDYEGIMTRGIWLCRSKDYQIFFNFHCSFRLTAVNFMILNGSLSFVVAICSS